MNGTLERGHMEKYCHMFSFEVDLSDIHIEAIERTCAKYSYLLITKAVVDTS